MTAPAGQPCSCGHAHDTALTDRLFGPDDGRPIRRRPWYAIGWALTVSEREHLAILASSFGHAHAEARR